MASPTTQKVADFFARYPQRTFQKRQLLIRPDTEPDTIFYLVEGRASQYDIAPSGAEIVVNIFKPGAFFPMSAAINKTSNPYFFEANTKVTAHIVPAAEAVQFLKDNPDVLFDLLSRVYRGVDGVLRRMAHLMGGDARSRLIFELLNAAYRFGEPQPDGSVHIALKEGDLARHSGLARETVSRHLQSLKAAGLLEVAHGGISVRGTHELEAILGAEL